MSRNDNSHPPADAATRPESDWIALVRDKVAGLRFGIVQITVHEGRVTQIERTERVRLENFPAR